MPIKIISVLGGAGSEELMLRLQHQSQSQQQRTIPYGTAGMPSDFRDDDRWLNFLADSRKPEVGQSRMCVISPPVSASRRRLLGVSRNSRFERLSAKSTKIP